MSEKRKNDTIIEGEYYDPDLPAQENTPPQKHRRTRSAGNVPKYNPASESIITKSNDLIQKTKYALPKLEQKVLLAMMAQINPKETPDADRVYSLSFSDFGRLAGVNMHDNTYLEYLKDTVKSLEDRSFWSLDPASDGHQYKVLSWLQRGSTVNDRDKQIRVRFNPEILPYLSQLKSNYTSYNVEYLLTMNSTYSMRFTKFCFPTTTETPITATRTAWCFSRSQKRYWTVSRTRRRTSAASSTRCLTFRS